MLAGRYRLDGVLGRGGMGVVWRAVDTLVERTVAIKDLRAPTGATDDERASFVERVLREARNAGRLNHPGVVAVYDVIAQPGEHDAVYIVMEHIQAPNLAELLDRNGPLPPSRVAVIGLGILDALEAAHALGIVHRDIKPGNVLVGAGDRVKLTDFGIALAAEDSRLTKSGVLGTQAYLAPECFDTGNAGPAADLWALGATLYHAVTGRAPFDRDTATATLRAILFEDLPAPPTAPRLADTITGLLTRPVGQRMTSAATRQLLQPLATDPGHAAPMREDAAVRPGQARWEANATSLHRQPALTPQQPAPPAGPGLGPPPQGPPSGGPPSGGPAPQGPPLGGPAPYPYPPVGGPLPHRRRKWPWIVGIAGLVVAIGGTLAVVLRHGDSANRTSAKNVAAFADKFFKADIAHDLDTMKKLSGSSIQDQLNHATTIATTGQSPAPPLGTTTPPIAYSPDQQLAIIVAFTARYGLPALNRAVNALRRLFGM